MSHVTHALLLIIENPKAKNGYIALRNSLVNRDEALALDYLLKEKFRDNRSFDHQK